MSLIIVLISCLQNDIAKILKFINTDNEFVKKNVLKNIIDLFPLL